MTAAVKRSRQGDGRRGATRLKRSPVGFARNLQVVAKQRVPDHLSGGGQRRAVAAPNTIHQVTDALEHLMAEDRGERPSLHRGPSSSAKARGGFASAGLLRLRREARTFRRRLPPGPRPGGFHAAEFNAAVVFWATPATMGNNVVGCGCHPGNVG